MSQDLITRYKRSYRLRFDNVDFEDGYRDRETRHSGDANLIGFGSLFVVTLTFAFLEYRAFGHDVSIPMYAYLGAAAFALLNLVFGWLGVTGQLLQVRLLANLGLAFGGLIAAVYLQKYSAYHALEFALLALWLAAANAFRAVVIFAINAIFAACFIATMHATGNSEFWLMLVSVILGVVVLLAAGIGYLMERSARLLYLQKRMNESVASRQEMWAFTLIDLDMALSGVLNLKELIGLLIKHLEPVIDFDSYVTTVLEGQGPKPVADKIKGQLFENEDRTIWSEDLLSKLTQTRQAAVSAEHEEEGGLFGMKKKRFVSYRLDIPVVNDSRLLGVISLRRAGEPFDELDMTAGVSIASQAMLIYRQSRRIPSASAAVPAPAPVAAPVVAPVVAPAPAPVPASASSESDEEKQTTAHNVVGTAADNRDLEVTDSNFNLEGGLVPSKLRARFKRDAEDAKKTITLMSRENAEKIASEHYRTAAIEGDSLSILIVEVDGLSKLREKDGDQVAYRVFAAIVKYIFSKVDKAKDVLGRYGQNGLSIVMPQIDMNAAERFAESLRADVAESRYQTPSGERSATLSIGVAAITDDSGDYTSMVKRADMALFVAKKNGRNCVKVRL